MKAVVLIACACIVAVTAQRRNLTESITEAFSITVGDAQRCIDKMKVTIEDMKKLEDAVRNGDEFLNQENVRRAMCTLTCAAQAQGTMVGAKLQMPKIHEVVNRQESLPEEVNIQLHKFINECYDDVKDISDECETGLKFVMCLIHKHPEYV